MLSYPFEELHRRRPRRFQDRVVPAMRYTNALLLLVASFTLFACAKAGKEVAEELGIVPSTCGTDGARVQATVGSDAFCADGQIVAVGDGNTALVTGIGLLGNTLSIQLDTLVAGSYPINDASNAVLFFSVGTTYTSTSSEPGTLVISAHDPATRRLKATVNVHVRNEMNGQSKAVEASLDVTYTTSD